MVTSLSCDCPSWQYYSVLRIILILLHNFGPNHNSNTNSIVQPSQTAQSWYRRDRKNHERFEECSRFMRGRLDYILQQNRTTSDRHVLGEINIGHYISGRNAWSALCTSSPERCQSSIKFRSGKLPYVATTRKCLSSLVRALTLSPPTKSISACSGDCRQSIRCIIAG